MLSKLDSARKAAEPYLPATPEPLQNLAPTLRAEAEALVPAGAKQALASAKSAFKTAESYIPPVQPVNPALLPTTPVIPESYLAGHEQRWFFASIIGLVETIKIWDILAPYFTNPDPTWSNSLRVASLPSAALWTALELSSLLLISLLRIPQFSPSPRQLPQLLFILVGWNLACWITAEPGAFLVSIDLLGPPSLGGAWYLAWWPLIKGLVWKDEPHLSGIHQIRLLPYSTATLNPLSLSYCLPPGSSQPLFIPVIFNNSQPEEISYYIRSLDTGHADVQKVSGSTLRKSSHHQPRLQLTDEEEDEAGDSDTDPLSALVLHQSGSSSAPLDVARLPSVKPADSLSMVPQHLSSSQSILYITVDRPGVISLQTVVDKRGDRFHITPHKEAIIIECPTGGDFVEPDGGQLVKKGSKASATPETRCIGEEEVAQFQVRGVGTLKAGWSKASKESTVKGVVEGIEDDYETSSDDQLHLVRKDKVSKTHTVPLRVVHDTPGIFTVTLTSVTDSLHNTYIPSGHSAEKMYNVLSRPSIRFHCPSPIQLLANGSSTVPIVIEGNNGQLQSSLSAGYTFKPTGGEIYRDTIEVGSQGAGLKATEPGVYTLIELNGQCVGSIMEPSSCSIEMIAPPSLDLKVMTLHEGAMDIGVNAAFDFSGTPPFMVYWKEQRTGSRPITQSKRFESYHGEIVLQPENEGQYTYTFTALSDRHYRDIKLDRPPIQQTVHPLANVDIVGRGSGVRRIKLYSCSGDQVDIELDAKGTPPLSLNYLMTSGTTSRNVTVDVKPGRSLIPIIIPKELDSESGASGKLTVTLISITDGDRRIRSLPAPTVEVDIHRQKPTVRFAKNERVVITEGGNARAALRLTGEPPWEVSYSMNSYKEKKVTLRDANNHLTLAEAGIYRLTQVRDAHCPGVVSPCEDTFEISFKPRPKAQLVASDALRLKDGVYTHKGFCAGSEDQIALHFDGQAPFELGYRHTAAGGHTARHTLKSAQSNGILHLDTTPGSHRYDITQLKDDNYPTNGVSLVLEHEVHSRPSASFIRSSGKPLCLDQSIQGDARIRLEGKAPFTLNLAVRKPTSTRVTSHVVAIDSHHWDLDLPQIVDEVGRYEVTLASISDASECQQIIYDNDILTTSVEVVESARIVPVSEVTDLCVGDTLDFLLQGKAPWTVEYEWLKKKHKVTSSASRFSRYAEEKGTFRVLSVALKDSQCKREISDMSRTVHPLPAVRIQEGLANLREGDDPAVFSVHFTGTPPFSFTYTRSEILGSKPRVVDTQTITDIWELDHTISSSLPGDYQVTSVSDKYCRYPPLSRGSKE